MHGGKPDAGSYIKNRGLKMQAAENYVNGAFTAG